MNPTSSTGSINPVLNTLTVVTDDDAAWVAYKDGPRDYRVDPKIADALKLEFSSPEQLMALMDVMRTSGINIDRLEVKDSKSNWDYYPYKYLTYLRDSGPKLYSLKGFITTKDGRETYIDINVGSFINMQRINRTNNPGGVETGGDKVSVYFVNPHFPWLIWSKE